MSRRKHALEYATYNAVAVQRNLDAIRPLPAAAPAAQRRADAGRDACYNDYVSVAQMGERPCREPRTLARGSQMQGSAQVRVLPDTHNLRCDVELARIALGLRQSAQMRLWLVIQEHVRETGYHYISRADLMALLERYGVKFTRRNLNRWLRAGQGVYWRLTTYGRVYLVSYERLAVNLTIEAYRHGLPDLVNTNLPGMTKAMYIDVRSANLLQFEAHCYKAWHANRNNPTISRFVLTRLWNRDERSLRRLEALSGIAVIPNEVETIEPSHVPLNADGTLRRDVYRTKDAYQRTVYHFHLPNTYQAGIVRQHHRRGSSRRVFGIIRNLIASEALAGLCGHEAQASGELCRSGRRYCETPKTAKHSRRRGNVGMLFVPDKPGRGRGVVWHITT